MRFCRERGISRNAVVDRWTFATKNNHKLAEVQHLIGDALLIEALPVEVPEAPEPYDTLYENALAKAAFYADRLQQPVIAEDSGLFVPALGGAPGTHTARFGGPARLLGEMDGIQDRRAYFVAVVVAYQSPGSYRFATGVWHGHIAEFMAGTEGFGYDPIFIPAGETLTVAQLGEAWKLQHSHRTRALRRLLLQLQK